MIKPSFASLVTDLYAITTNSGDCGSFHGVCLCVCSRVRYKPYEDYQFSQHKHSNNCNDITLCAARRYLVETHVVSY